MSIILSLQRLHGCRKTTALRYLQEFAPYSHISFEANNDIIDEIQTRDLNKNQKVF